MNRKSKEHVSMRAPVSTRSLSPSLSPSLSSPLLLFDYLRALDIESSVWFCCCCSYYHHRLSTASSPLPAVLLTDVILFAFEKGASPSIRILLHHSKNGPTRYQRLVADLQFNSISMANCRTTLRRRTEVVSRHRLYSGKEFQISHLRAVVCVWCWLNMNIQPTIIIDVSHKIGNLWLNDERARLYIFEDWTLKIILYLAVNEFQTHKKSLDVSSRRTLKHPFVGA